MYLCTYNKLVILFLFSPLLKQMEGEKSSKLDFHLFFCDPEIIHL